MFCWVLGLCKAELGFERELSSSLRAAITRWQRPGGSTEQKYILRSSGDGEVWREGRALMRTCFLACGAAFSKRLSMADGREGGGELRRVSLVRRLKPSRGVPPRDLITAQGPTSSYHPVGT